MAQKVTVALEDDLDGGPADETVRFGFGGTDCEIDLSATNARAFRKKLAPFIEHARKAGRGRARDGADFGRPAAQRRGPGVGQRPRHHSQGTRPDPRQRDRAVPGRRPRTLNQAEAAARSTVPHTRHERVFACWTITNIHAERVGLGGR